jgi:hypothetical protein
MGAKAAGVTFEDFHIWSAGASNYKDETDCRSVWNSIREGGITNASLFHAARANGWRDDSTKLSQYSHDRQIKAKDDSSQQTTQEPNRLVLELWERCVPATADHPYVVAKRGKPDGLRVVGAGDTTTITGLPVLGWLVVPAFSLDGELRTLQLIPPPGTGKKLNVPRAPFGDGLFVVGDIDQSPRVFIVEGIGQAWACWSATGHAAVVCFGAGRMGTVVALLRKRFDTMPIVLVSDKGKETQAATFARRVSGQWVEMPDDKPSNYDANDYAAEHGADELAALLENTKTPERRYRVLAANDLLNTPPLRWLVRGVLPAHGLACMYGASGSGKSFLALDVCAAVAGGVEWFNCRVTRAPVVYVALEGEHGFLQRVNAWQRHHGKSVPANLRFVIQPFDLRSSSDLAELGDAIKSSGASGGLLVIDTLNRAAGGADENSSKDMGDIIHAAKELQTLLGGTVLLIHHSGKDLTKGLRGHSSLYAALDSAIEVRRDGDRREWTIAKSKDDGDSATYPFHLEVVGIGIDEHGDQLTSCAVAADNFKAKAMFQKALPPKSGNQRVAWNALGDILRNAGDERPKDAPKRLPVGRPAVALDSAIDAVRSRLACDSKRRTERAQQALTGLQTKGVIQIDEGYVWAA